MRVYADNAATTRTDPEILEKMIPVFTETYGNPSSIHTAGREAFFVLKEARDRTAKALGALPDEIYFTSGGTEADNWAILGTAKKYAAKGKHIISSAIEHHAVLHTLEKGDFDVTYLPVNEEGFVFCEDLENAIREDTVLVTVMMANNEIGAIQPIKKLAEIAHQHNVLFHTDAVQAVGHIPLDVKELGVDMLSLSGHKFNAPKGIGALYVRKGLVLPNLMQGGAQEKGKRPGTENVPGAYGMSLALEKAVANLPETTGRLCAMRDKLIDGILSSIPHCRRNSPTHDCLPGLVNVSVKYLEGESILLMLDMNGICASSGSACTSGSLDPSHVLLALGLDHETAHGSVRFSLNHSNTEEEVDYILEKFPQIITRLREMSPLWEKVENKQG